MYAQKHHVGAAAATGMPGMEMPGDQASPAGHGKGMSHDMSDPAMAASMEAEIRTRFWVALALSMLVVLMSASSIIVAFNAVMLRRSGASLLVAA